MISFKIDMWPIERFKLYENNPRKNDHVVDKMAESLKFFGIRRPIVALEDGLIVDGHLIYKGAVRAGFSELPRISADDLSGEQIKAFRLVVNRSATWASWDEDKLIKEISALIDSEFDITLTGFDQHELDKLMLELQSSDKNPDDVPDVSTDPVVREGELWLLGRHRLMCGDSANSVQVGYLLNGQPADMVWTDPPYNVDYKGKAGKILNDKMSASMFDEFLYQVFTQIHAALRPGGAIYVSHSEAGNGLAFRVAFNRAGFKLASCIIWNKLQAVMSRGDYHWQHEPVLYGWKRGAAHKWYGTRKHKTIKDVALPGVLQQEDGSWTVLVDGKVYHLTGQDICLQELSTTVIDVVKPSRSDKHPTTKPVALIEQMIANSSRSGDLVYEPFSGSGSTMIACERLGRDCCAMELEPDKVQQSIIRWQDYTGLLAVRAFDGIVFDELL